MSTSHSNQSDWGNPQIETTADGSATLYLPTLDEHYHSVKGAVAESQHIYIGMGLQAIRRKTVHLFEMGFGTGLNAFLTLLAAQQSGKQIHYTTLERYPLTWEIVSLLGYEKEVDSSQQSYLQALHQAPWGEPVAITPFFTLHKQAVDIRDYPFEAPCDLIYYDAFAPEKQPELWNETLFCSLYNMLNPGGILTTYCAKGEVRRRLQRAGFQVERLPGPPGGKREILRGRK